jgi:hypothetical protein
MQAILWIAFFLTVWTALAIWTVRKSRSSGIPFDRERTLRVLASRTAGATAQRPNPTTMQS